MSRTDKDTPWWVQAKHWEPVHSRYCVESRLYWYRQHYPERVHECDLPEGPEVKHPFRRRTIRGVVQTEKERCQWWPVVKYYSWDKDAQRGAYWWTSPPRDFRRAVFYGPERRRKREECRKAAQEYNSWGEVETDPWGRPSRNSAQWDWH